MTTSLVVLVYGGLLGSVCGQLRGSSPVATEKALFCDCDHLECQDSSCSFKCEDNACVRTLEGGSDKGICESKCGSSPVATEKALFCDCDHLECQDSSCSFKCEDNACVRTLEGGSDKGICESKCGSSPVVVGSCGGEQPSKVKDCQNIDLGSCGNGCCKLEIGLNMDARSAMTRLNNTWADGGPDGHFTRQMTAEGALGFADLIPFKVPTGVAYIGQAHHMTSGPKHYNDTIDVTITPNGEGKSTIRAFSMSLIGGALGDNGQNYKNLMMTFQALEDDFSIKHLDGSCPPLKLLVV